MEVGFGIWDHFERRPGIPLAQQYREKVDLIVEAERLGYAYYHVAEHHLSPLDLAPSPSLFLAAAAQATSRIRLGTGVFCLPMYHPLRLVQELGMLDNICDGRLDVGVGRGIRAAEHDWFGLPQGEVQGRFNETLQFLTSAFSNANISHHGEYFHFDPVPLDILPVQRPYPPLWYAGGAETAGKAGMNFLGRGPADAIRYWDLWEETKQRPDRINAHVEVPKVALTRHLVVRESYDEAYELAKRAWPVFESNWFATPILVNEDGRASASIRAQTTDFDEALKQDRRVIVATPSQLIERWEGWLDAVGDRPSLFFTHAVQWGDISRDEATETLAIIARDVAPVLREKAKG